MNKKSYLWTKAKARLQLIKTSQGENYNWLFLPGGPGLGSEYLASLTDILELPGNIWYLDLPGDGSNLTGDDTLSFSNWSEALAEAVNALENVILVAHSSGGMFALAIPQLKQNLRGLVLLDSAPDASWQHCFKEYTSQNPLPGIGDFNAELNKDPSNETMRKQILASLPYYFKTTVTKEHIELFEKLPFNYKSYLWSVNNFNDTYTAKWIPDNIPTMILGGDSDYLTPLYLFKNSTEFQTENIMFREIQNAGHFPWLENPEQVVLAFKEFLESMKCATNRDFY